VDLCALSPCKNGATCFRQNNDYTCKCPITYTGRNCTTDKDECNEAMPCRNGGSCYNSIGFFNCTCTNQYVGKLCE
ncbi:predicted protein, partial [Nematostella vectensis]